MLTSIQDSVLQLIPSRSRRSPSGWISFNAVCCQYRGESQDTRGRAGIIVASDGSVSYHCFNCHFKTGYRPGYYLGYSFRRLLAWLGADENTINRLVIEAVRIRDTVETVPEQSPTVVKHQFRPRALPDDVRLVDHDPQALAYCLSRAIDLDRYPLLVSAKTEYNLNRRVIIPFTYQNQLIGYTARAWDSKIKPRYYSQYEPNYVFNIDRQCPDAKFVIVCEGPFDAISVDGCAVLTNQCSDIQVELIESLNREVIVVPDRDRAGVSLINQAINFGWTVSFPVWHETCKDCNEAVVRYGKLFTLYSILQGCETNKLKIKLLTKKLIHN